VIRLLARIRRLLYSVGRRVTVGASLMAIDDDGRLLLVRQSYGSDRWVLPGGGAHRGESLHDAALREGWEEAGVRPRPDGTCALHGVYLRRDGGWTDHVAVFVARGWDIEERRSWEIAELGRFPLDALPPTTAASVRRRVDELLGATDRSDHW